MIRRGRILIIKSLYILIDILCLALSIWAACWLRQSTLSFEVTPHTIFFDSVNPFRFVFLFWALAAVLLNKTYGLYKVKDYCKKYGLDFSIASVASHQDFSDGTFDRMIDFAEKEKIYLTVNPIIPTGYASTKQELLLNSEDVKKLNKISKKSIYVSTHLTNNYFGFGCPAGNAYIGVNVTGEMFPCFFIPVSLGNVQNMSLRQAWEKACSSPLFTKRHKMCYAAYSR